MLHYKTLDYLTGFFFGTISYFLGGWDSLLRTILFLTIIDFLTGIFKAIFQKTFSCRECFKGITRKIIIFFIIAVSNTIQQFLNDSIPLRETIIVFYIFNEALSILENAAFFIPIPSHLKDSILNFTEKNRH